jgi:hypothetical protein
MRRKTTAPLVTPVDWNRFRWSWANPAEDPD